MNDSSAAAIRAEGLTKVFANGVRAVDALSLEVARGEIFGFLGPNGAGKTTTVRLLNGTLTPTAGRSFVLGRESRDETLRLNTATVSEEAQMYDHLSVQDNLRFFAAMYDLKGSGAEERIRELLERMRLWEKRRLKLGGFSTGMKKRAQLARALLAGPAVLFLDEPTSGLDAEGALAITTLIRRLASERKVTIFLCTHNLFLAERICDRLAFIDSGRLAACGAKKELLRSGTEQPQVRIRTLAGERAYSYTDESEIDALIRRLQAEGERIVEVRPVEPTLEEVYFRTLGRERDELE